MKTGSSGEQLIKARVLVVDDDPILRTHLKRLTSKFVSEVEVAADGAEGLPGMNGISVAGVSCVQRHDLSTAFRFTFSDVSFVDVPGACLP